MTRWFTRYGAALCFLGLLCLAYADPLFGPRAFGGRDLTAYNYPTEAAVHDAYARGRWPVWEADISGGRPLLPNPNTGALYPVRWLLSHVRLPLAMRIYPVLHWFLAGAGMLALLRRLGVSISAAWIAAVTYVFSGVSVSEVSYLHIQPGMTLLPWILWVVVRKKLRALDAALLGALFGLDMLGGDVFTVAMGAFCAALWIVLEDVSGQKVRRLGILALGVGLGALSAAPQILATALWIPETNRAVVGMKLVESIYFSVSPWRLLEFVVPYPFGDVWALDDSLAWGQNLYHGRSAGLFATLYLGAFPLLALFFTARERIRGARWARLLLVISLVFAVLPALTPSSWLAAQSPIPLRNPEKLVVSAAFALSVLAGLGLENCRNSRWTLRWPLVIGAAIGFAAVMAAVFSSAAGRIAVAAVSAGAQKAPLAGQLLPIALAEGGLLWMAALLAVAGAAGKTRTARVLGLLVLSLLPIAADRRIAQTFREEEIFAPTAFARTLDRRDPGGRFRVLGESAYHDSASIYEDFCRGADPSFNDWARITWVLHTHAFWKRGTVFNRDFDNGDLSRVESLRRVAQRLATSSDPAALFESLSLRWGVRFRDQDPLPGFRPFGGDLLQAWDELPAARPPIRLLDKWQETRGSLESLEGLTKNASEGPFLDTGQRRQGRSSGGRVRFLEDTPERLRANIEVSDAGWLFVMRAFWSQRDVLLDGRPAEVVPAQLAFSAVSIPPGTHRLDWIERVPGWEISRWGPALFFLMILGMFIRERARRSAEQATPV